MRTTRIRRQKGWGGFGLPTLLLLLALGGCGADVETEGGEGELPATTVASTAAPGATTTTAEVTTTKAMAMEPAPRFFTRATPSGTYLMKLGASSTLQLPNDSAGPDVRGESVAVIDVASVAPAGSKQWELRAVAHGETVLVVEVDGSVIIWALLVTD